MKKAFLLILLIAIAELSVGQSHASKVSITSQEYADRIEIFAANNNPIPVSISLSFNMEGLEEVVQGSKYKIIQSDRPPQLVAKLSKIPNSGWTYRYAMQVYLGDFYSSGHDSAYVYTLPFQKGAAYYVSQGYNGSFSHQNENAIDFIMPEGTPIMAIRSGVVAEVIEHNNDGCPNRSCIKLSNSILIYHEDGSFARYAHLQLNGALVNVGDRVSPGDHIGLSGNTGWSSEPHLHFSVFEIEEGNVSYSVPTLFQTSTGPVYLEEKKKYLRP